MTDVVDRTEQFMLDELEHRMNEMRRSVDARDTYDEFRKLALQYQFIKGRMELRDAMKRHTALRPEQV